MILHGVQISAADYPQAKARAASANSTWDPERRARSIVARNQQSWACGPANASQQAFEEVNGPFTNNDSGAVYVEGHGHCEVEVCDADRDRDRDRGGLK